MIIWEDIITIKITLLKEERVLIETWRVVL